MPMQSYLLPGNSGKQIWQMMKSNLTPGDHPYNFTGFCMALVTQWLLEVKFKDGVPPEDLARYLLIENIGTHGYGGIAKSQHIYKNNINENDASMIQRHSGGALTLNNLETRHSPQAYWRLIHSRVYNTADDEIIRLNDQSVNYSGLIGLSGRNSCFLRPFLGNNWGHAIGIHSNINRIYIFDPNYGIFIFDQKFQGIIRDFITTMWNQYHVAKGDLADIL